MAKKAKKKNPTDATMRNVQAARTRHDNLVKRVATLEKQNVNLTLALVTERGRIDQVEKRIAALAAIYSPADQREGQ